jgi:hypothetical protein
MPDGIIMSEKLGFLKSQHPSALVLDVTPDFAAEVLASMNTRNRRVKPSVVEKYAKMMRNGSWTFSPETVSISKSGTLLNGQHRLLAVIESGTCQKFMFATGFNDDVFGVLDRGAGRTRADALGLGKKLVEIASLFQKIKSGSKQFADCEVMADAIKMASIHDALIEAAPTASKNFSSAPFRLAAVVQVMNGADSGYVFNLYRSLVLGDTDALPPIGHAAIKAHLDNRWRHNSGGSTQVRNLCGAWHVFNPKMKDRKRISIGHDPDVLRQIVEVVDRAKA